MNGAIRVLHGHPTSAELAAVTAVLLALAARDEGALRSALEQPSAGWALRQGAHHAAGSWISVPRPMWQPSD
ncbi:acyl-CoA carboxylase subunit epsilon [Streptomyces sp. TRM 70361]|uniref:acyl-CoA carboxylase subunit epsilon n=1 Tax=Streptomyces sp. TRM 70361 TaxID=3116553 RepID=UPI002E7B23C6|nr:acyl-CoA carboxylase subunit epsilon [Streptomyces sp. TRM 70361]MEE1940384.1 acyl-CoA carboxylase subunit epsilon [Streptomyces sp. TRM 70361]